MLHLVALILASLFGVLVIAVFLIMALAVSFEPIVSEWEARECPRGGAHEDETVEPSAVSSSSVTYRCTKCGRVAAAATYAL